jgi:hypothetical protein
VAKKNKGLPHRGSGILGTILIDFCELLGLYGEMVSKDNLLARRVVVVLALFELDVRALDRKFTEVRDYL